MNRRVALKAGLVQLVAVAVLAVVLGLALGHHFFEDNGWFAGPAAWMACAALSGGTASRCAAGASPMLPRYFRFANQ